MNGDAAAGAASRCRLKYLASINDDALGEDTDADFEMQYIDIGNVDRSGHISELASYRFEDAPSRARRIVRDGDVIISTVRTYLQAITQIHEPPDNLVVSTGFAVVRPLRDRFDARYCRFALREPDFLAEVEKRSVGVNYPAINAADLAGIPIPVHPLPRQRAIADYLDREIARLDALMAAKQRLLDLLAEKRRALIARAVTRGLDPDGSLPISGDYTSGARLGSEDDGDGDHAAAAGSDDVSFFDWVERLPESWEAKPLRAIANCTVSNVDKAPSEEEIQVRLCNYTEVYHNEFITLELGFMNATASKDEINRFRLSIGDVIITKDSESWDDIGVPALVRETDDDLVCGYHLALLRPDRRIVDGSFLLRCLQAKPIRLQLELAATGVTRFGLPKFAIGAAVLPIPPLAQQRAIADYLDRETARLDGLMAKIRETVSLLKERRAALIAAAVAGRLDVGCAG